MNSAFSSGNFSLHYFFNHYYFHPLQSVILDIVSSGSVFPVSYLFSHNLSFSTLFCVNSSRCSLKLLLPFSSLFIVVFLLSWCHYYCSFPSVLSSVCPFHSSFSCFISVVSFRVSSLISLTLVIRIFSKFSVLSCLDFISLRSAWSFIALIIFLTSNNFLLSLHTYKQKSPVNQCLIPQRLHFSPAFFPHTMKKSGHF